MKRYAFFIFWLMLIALLLVISLNYSSKESAMSAVVESQVTAISYQEPVIVQALYVIPGQEVAPGDTLLVVSRPDLALSIERKQNELERITTQIVQERQDFQRRIALDEIERSNRINQLTAERNELQAEIQRKESIRNQFAANRNTAVDTVRQIRLIALEQEIGELKTYYLKEQERQKYLLEERLTLLSKEEELVRKELDALQNDAGTLVKVARSKAIVGAVNVQLDELVSPFKTILSLYEVHPSVIKAYIMEGFTAPVGPGDKVRVTSESRQYTIEGQVVELGARITSIPPQLNQNTATQYYGQEIFITIPNDNQFLNGERVLVFPKIEEGR